MSSTAFYMRQEREGDREPSGKGLQLVAPSLRGVTCGDKLRLCMYMSQDRALYVELELELELQMELGKCDLQLGAECGVDQHGAARAIEVIVN